MLIALEGMLFRAYHGCHAHERETGSEFEVDIYIDVINNDAALDTDHLADTLDYESVYCICKTEMQIPSNLLEHLAGRILHKLTLFASQRIRYIKVRIAKLNPPIGGTTRRALVELEKKLS